MIPSIQPLLAPVAHTSLLFVPEQPSARVPPDAVLTNDKRWLETPACVPSKLKSAGDSCRRWVLNEVWPHRMKIEEDSR